MMAAAERMRARRVRLRESKRCQVCGHNEAQSDKSMCVSCQKDTYARVKLSRLIAGVRDQLLQRLGTPVTEGPIDDRYGEGRFLHHHVGGGVLQFQIILLKHPSHPRAAPLDFLWRGCSAKELTDDLVAAYEALRAEHPWP